jgi:hypothetical protein
MLINLATVCRMNSTCSDHKGGDEEEEKKRKENACFAREGELLVAKRPGWWLMVA